MDITPVRTPLKKKYTFDIFSSSFLDNLLNFLKRLKKDVH